MAGKYKKKSRFNPSISFEQYKELLRYKALKDSGVVVYYRELCRKWGLNKGTVASAVNRGMKQYDTILERERDQQSGNNRQYIPAGSLEKRTEIRTLGVRPKPTEASRASPKQYTQGGTVRGGYSDFIRTEYFEE